MHSECGEVWREITPGRYHSVASFSGHDFDSLNIQQASARRQPRLNANVEYIRMMRQALVPPWKFSFLLYK